MIYHLFAIILAYYIDYIIGDPKNWPHPVKAVGGMISFFDKRWNKGRNQKLKGAFMLVIIVLTTFSVVLLLTVVSYQLHPLVGVAVEAIIIATTIAQKGLMDAALAVYHPLQSGKLSEARMQLSWIVGRDTEKLPEKEIARGAVETVAENTSDGITAPLFWSLVGGAPLAMVYRAVNTCDSMVGYRNEKYRDYGWASARLDDVLNWIPARATAFVMMMVMKPKYASWKKSLGIMLRDARNHRSPNSGWGEAAVAAILGVALGGTNVYQGKKSITPKIGEAFISLNASHILDTVKIMRRTAFLFLIWLIVGGMLFEIATARI